MASDAATPPPNPRQRARVVLWMALVITVLGGVLLYNLVLSAKESKALMKKPPVSGQGRFLGQGNDEDRRPARPRPTASSSASATPSAP